MNFMACHTGQKPLRIQSVSAAKIIGMVMAKYYAHTATESHPRPADGRGAGGEGWQPLADHLRNVTDLAEKFAAPFNLGEEAKLAWLLHELMTFDVRTTKLASHAS
jgi:hypothetical protein